MTQTEAPVLTVATIGHPANERYIIKASDEVWRHVRSGDLVDEEDFRAGWDIVSLPPAGPSESP